MPLAARALRATALSRPGSPRPKCIAFSTAASRQTAATAFHQSALAAGNEDYQVSLEGTNVAVKDNICTRNAPNIPTTCDSNILGPGFLSPYNATVVELLQQAGSNVIGKTHMDEFGMGSHSIHTTFDTVFQEDSNGRKLSAGGSSGGSAVAVQSRNCHYALGTDTGGSVRLPAAYTGVCGFKPSYGLLSRWGVIAYANSLDTVGILAREAAIIRKVFDALNHHDPKDPTSLPESTRSSFRDHQATERHGMRIGFPVDYNVNELHPAVRDAWSRTLQNLADSGHIIRPISLPRTKQALSAYYVLAPSEAASNLAKYDGVRYGRRAVNIADNDGDGYIYAKTRGEGFGMEVKRRILLGAYSLSAAAIDNYFIQAQRVRRLVQKDFDSVFVSPNKLHKATPEDDDKRSDAKVDFIVCPTAPTPPPFLEEVQSWDKDPLNAYINDVFTVPASLAGLPAISVPALTSNGKNEENIGIQIIGQFGHDYGVLDLASQLQ